MGVDHRRSEILVTQKDRKEASLSNPLIKRTDPVERQDELGRRFCGEVIYSSTRCISTIACGVAPSDVASPASQRVEVARPFKVALRHQRGVGV